MNPFYVILPAGLYNCINKLHTSDAIFDRWKIQIKRINCFI